MNASANPIKVGFANSNPDYNEHLLYCEFKYSFKACYKKDNSKKLKHYNSTIEVDDFDAAEHSVYTDTVKQNGISIGCLFGHFSSTEAKEKLYQE